MQQININDRKYEFDSIPNECPHCHKSIHVKLIGHHEYTNGERDFIDLVFSCPSQECLKSFTYTYQLCGFQQFENRGLNTGTSKKYKFSEEINRISPNFSKIYNQSANAEENRLTEICGCGYRKALEFLIKDYLVFKIPGEKEKIVSMFISTCIKEYIDDPRLLTAIERAVWLGNDETHYTRIWEGKNLDDLKKLISLSLHWIEMELLTINLEKDMPNKKSRK